jgi:hypothetical protein
VLQALLLAAHQTMINSSAGSCWMLCSPQAASCCRAAASAQTYAQQQRQQLRQLLLAAAAAMVTWQSHCCKYSQLFAATVVAATTLWQYVFSFTSCSSRIPLGVVGAAVSRVPCMKQCWDTMHLAQAVAVTAAGVLPVYPAAFDHH